MYRGKAFPISYVTHRHILYTHYTCIVDCSTHFILHSYRVQSVECIHFHTLNSYIHQSFRFALSRFSKHHTSIVQTQSCIQLWLAAVKHFFVCRLFSIRSYVELLQCVFPSDCLPGKRKQKSEWSHVQCIAQFTFKHVPIKAYFIVHSLCNITSVLQNKSNFPAFLYKLR